MEAQVLGLSVDSPDCLRAWADSLGGITYPLLSDFFPHGQVAQLYGVFRREGFSERSIFVIDKEGIVRYVDVHEIGDQPDNEVVFDELRKLAPEAAAKFEEQERAVAAAAAPRTRPEADLVVYCTPWCPDCRKARNWLKEHGIAFAEVDISKDRAAAVRVREWAGGHETTPTFDYQGKIIVDWEPEALEEALRVKQ
jgi:glutaredoxin